MSTELFTLELIADCLWGPSGSCSQEPEEEPLQPALGIRVLDLPCFSIDAPEGEDFEDEEDSCISFASRGKALVFELPEALIESGTPLPLWLMLLAKRGASVAATLLASACIDLRSEVLKAMQHERRGALAGPVAFRSCSFRMSPVIDQGCRVTLNCFVRLYAGAHQPLSGGELLLEPAAMLSVDTAGPQRPTSTKRCSAETQTEAPPALAPALEKPPLESPGEGTASEAKKIAAGDLRLTAERRPRTPLPPPPADPGSSEEMSRAMKKLGAFFPEEICLGGELPGTSTILTTSAELGGVLTTELTAPSTLPELTKAPGEVTVSSSLPLVSELLRELWQIRSVT